MKAVTTQNTFPFICKSSNKNIEIVAESMEKPEKDQILQESSCQEYKKI